MPQKTSRPWIVLLVMGVTASSATLWSPLPVQETITGLENAFEEGGLIQDRNGDGHIDFVNARLVVGPQPGLTDVVAAANIAARLGFETESMDLPLVDASEGIPVVIGRSAMESVGVEPSSLGVDLEPGIGIVSYLEAPPGPMFVIAGGDDAGLRAAVLAFGGRAPFLWEPDGPTYAHVVESVRLALDSAGVPVRTVSVRNAMSDDQPGLRRLDVSVIVTPGAVSEGAAVLTRISRTDSTELRTDSATTDSIPPHTALRFDGLRLLRLDVSSGNGEATVVYVANTRPPEPIAGRRPGGGSKDRVSLSNLISNDGLLGDSDNDLIPDRVDVVLSPGGETNTEVVNLAARLALESTGMTFPMVLAPDEIDEPADLPTLLLIGAAHPLVRELADSNRVQLPELVEGQGWVGIVPDAFDEKPAVVVVGGNAAGEARAIRQLAEVAPHLWNRGKDRPTLSDVDVALRGALAGRSPVGQAAMAVYKLNQIADELRGRDLRTAHVEVFVDKADNGLAAYLRSRMSTAFAADTVDFSVGNLDVQNARQIFTEAFDIPSEVDVLRRHVRDSVLPRVGPGVRVHLEGRLSEPPEIRRKITEELTLNLIAAGVAREDISIRIVSAYKQGFSWLSEFVSPALAREHVDDVIIRFAEIGPPDGWPQQAMYTPTRWVLELFPVDEVLSRDLGLDLERIRFEKLPVGSVTYEVIGMRAEEVVYRESFEPSLVLRPYFDRFPDYEMSRVTTGWITGVVGSDTVVNRRIVTDIESFWDHFQSSTLMRIYDHVMAVNEGGPRASDAPHFGELVVDVSLSEPDYRIGVDEEQVASMEALHEEIYFGVLHFFDVLGRLARGQALDYPGRVIPIVRPKSDGGAGTATISFTGFDAPGPSVKVLVRDREGHQTTLRRDLLPLPFEEPRSMSGTVQDGLPGWSSVHYRVPVDFQVDNRREWVLRTSARNIDSRITTAEQTIAVMSAIGDLRTGGLYGDGLAYDHLGTLSLSAYWGHDFDPDSQLTVTLPPNGTPPDLPRLSADGYEWSGERLVQWDTPIPPPEAADILARMATFPEATVYRVGESYLGKDIWAMDLVAPVDGAFWSQAKATARKPTVIYSARQHANEVSSTSHVLRLAEQILTDSAYADVLKSVNVVIHPITNPDGAQLAYDLHLITPNHMLHAGYLGALGVDVTSGQGDESPMYPETNIRPNLWRTWLPDVFLNPHGYPSHEWVQIFSEYAGWVRSRVTSQRGWWGMRGWFMPSFNYVDSPDYPRHRVAAFEIRDRITESINALPEIRRLNERAYDRYRRYAFAFDTENFKMDFADSVLIYTSILGSSGQGGAMANPRVTVWSGTTEAPDETARGEWLQLVASAGLAWDNAILDYLVEGNHEVERSVDGFDGGVTFRIQRDRPPKNEEEN